MKSIVQEATSVAKAIERGLEKAENPRDFSVKILEYPEKNFFGLTTKPAKIALYFDDKARKPHEAHALVSVEKEDAPRGRSRERGHGEQKDNDASRNKNNNNTRKQVNSRKPEPYAKTPPPVRSAQVSLRRLEEPAAIQEVTGDALSMSANETFRKQPDSSSDTHVVRQRREDSVVRWNPEIVQYARDWLTRVLTEMHHLVPFSLDVDRFHIKITLDRPLFDDSEHERRVLASLSLLMLETCKHAFKVNLRDHRVVLTHRS